MKKVFFTLTATAMSIILLTVACKHEVPLLSASDPVVKTPVPPAGSGTGSSNAGSTCSPDTVYFRSEIQPLIVSGCTSSGCHNDLSKASGITLSSYANIMRYVNPGNSGSSKLYTVLVKTGNERMPLPPLPAFTTDQIAKVNKWIRQGAKDNFCINTGCDTTLFTFSAAVQPVMQTNCVGCHSTTNAGGGIDLSTYTGVKTVALNGRLMGSMNMDPGFSAMPKGGAKLAACNLTQIKKWIAAGALNN